MRGPNLLNLCALAFLLLCTIAHGSKCPTGCQGVTPNIFKYQEGTTYKYGLDSSVEISLSSAEGQQVSTKVRGNVLLTQQADCVQVIRLQNIQVVGPDGKKYSNLPNADKAIAINFHDGHVEDEICAEPDDTQNSLNLKRAVASMFQAALKHHHESDVFGDCPNEITSRKEGANVIIHKVRNLNRCGRRESIKQDFMATSFNLNSEIKASPLLNADYESEQRVKNGILDNAVITENYLYKPFSTGKNGAKAIVVTKLNFMGQSKDAVKSKPTEAKPIYFDNPHMETTKTANVDNIVHALKETKKTMDVSVGEKSAKTFAQLIRVLRASKKDDILAVYGQIKSGAAGLQDRESARKVFFDALFRTGTGDAVEVAIQLIKSKELSPVEQRLVFLSLSFIKHATPGSLKAAADLVDLPNLPREAFLGIGTLAGRYCKEHNCDHLSELDKLMTKMVSKLNANPKTHKEENVDIAILKGLANMHHLNDNVLEKLVLVASDKKTPARLRVAALETFLSDACKPKLRETAMNILKNRDEDSEIRIKAYLVVAHCPDSKVAHALQELLDTEPVYQVGGFIVSHLRNLRSSANPDREQAKQHLSMVRTTKKFPIDMRKYSFNNEISYNVDSVGLGSSAESNVIYSQNSFLPRSTSLNLTTELFGHSFNFLEIGTRQDNLDKVLEHYLGPLGVLRSHTPEELYTTGKASMGKLAEHIRKRYEKTRGKRDLTKNVIDNFAKQIKVLDHDLDNDLDLDLSVKILGSEMLFLSINEDIQKLTPDAIIDKIFDTLDQGIEKAKNFDLHMKNHLMFLDTELSYPTSMGFPLRLSVEGTTAMHFMSHGNLDVRQILKDPKNAEMKLSVIPSANIELSAMMAIDSHFIEAGLKVSSSLLTSTGADMSIKMLDNGKGIDIKMGIPVEQQKLVSFNHEIVFSTQELGKPEIDLPLKFKDKMKDFSMCFDQLSPIIGLSFCGELNTPASLTTNMVPFPLNGPAQLSISIDREDVKEYHFKALINDQKPHHKTLEIILDTPKSKTNRQVSLLLEAMLDSNKMVKATLKSPFKSATAEAVITDTDKEKSAMLRLQYDTSEYYGKIGVSVQGSDAKHIYKPLIEYHTPGDLVKTKGNRKPDYTVEGQVIVEKQADHVKYVFDHVKIIAPGQPPVMVNGFLARDGAVFSGDVKVSRDQMNVGVKGDFQATKDKMILNTELENSINPNVNFNLKYETSRAAGQFENKLTLVHGPDLKSKKHTFSLLQSAKYLTDTPEYSLNTKNKITYPLLGLDFKLDVEASKKHFDCDLVLGYDKFKLESELDAKFSTKTVGDYDIEFDLKALTNKFEIKAKRDIAGDKSTVKNMVQFNGKKYVLDGTVMHHVKPNELNIGTDLVLKIHGKPDDIKIDTGVISNAKEINSHSKITMGKEVLVDMLVKGTKGVNPNGNLKIFVIHLIDVTGNVKVNNGVGSGSVLVSIPKMARKLKAETSFTCQDPVHNMNLDVYFDFEKDNSKKLHMETNNQITKNSIESKNLIDIMGHKLEGNLKGKMEGSIMDGKVNGEFDIHLPNDHYFTGKLNREVHVVNQIMNGNGHVTLTHKPKKDGPAHMIDFKVAVKDTSQDRKVFDIVYNLILENTDGKNIKADIVLKHHHHGEKHISVYKSKLYGSIIPQPLEVEVTGTYTNREGNYKGHTKYGTNLGVIVGGKYNFVGGATPMTADIDVEVMTPNDKYKNMKLHASGSMKMPQNGGACEASGLASVTLNNAKTIKVEGNMNVAKHDGDVKVTLHIPEEEPMSVAVNYGHEDAAPGFGKCKCGMEVHYGKGKTVTAKMTLNRPNGEEMDLEFDLVTPSETAQHINLKLKGKKSNDGKHINSEIVLTADKNRYSLTKELIISEVSPSVDIVITYPSKKQSRIFAKFQRTAPKHFLGEIKLESLKDFSLEMSGDANLESIDNFHIILNIHSEKLKLDKVKVEVTNKPAKSGKKIQFSAKSGDKNLISGSTNYKAHEEGGKFIVEGSGSFKVKEESKTASFKYIRQSLEQEKDGEQGIVILLNAGVGTQSIIGELKLTNKQFRIMNSYCEEKKQCAHVEVFSKSNNVDVSEFNNELEINIDLKKLGLSHEFGLKAVTNRKNYVLDHTVDIHFESSANSKYQYSLYVHPKEAGIVLTMPKRVIALESKFDAPISKERVGPIKGEIAFYMNKVTEPNKKTVLSFNGDQIMNQKEVHTNMEIKFSNPNLQKDMTVKYDVKLSAPASRVDFTMEVDVFGKKSHKIMVSGFATKTKLDSGLEVNAELTAVSKGLNLEVKATEQIRLQLQDVSYGYKLMYHLDKTKSESALSAKVNPKKVELLVKLMNKDLLHVDSTLQLSKDVQMANTQVAAAGIKPLVSHLEIKNYNTMIFTLAKKETPNNKLQVSSGFIFGQIADFRAEVHKGKDKNDLIHASIKLDDAHFMKPDFGLNVENIQKLLLEPMRIELTGAAGQLKKLGDEYQKLLSDQMQQFAELVKKNMPNLKPMISYYQTELNKLREELISDKTIQEVTEFMKKVFGAFAHTMTDIFQKLSEMNEKLVSMFQEHISKITDVIAKEILPAVKEFGGKLLDMYVSVMKNIYDVMMIYLVKLSDLLKAHQGDLKNMATVFSEAFQDIGQFVMKAMKSIRDELQHVLQGLIEQIKALPIFEELKERYNELLSGMPVPDHVINILIEIGNTIKDVMPTTEMKEFITVTQEYINKKLKREKVDDTECFKKIYASFVRAVNSLVRFIRTHQGSPDDVRGVFENMLPLPIDTLLRLPRLMAIRLSLVNLLANGDLPSPRQILSSMSFNPVDWIPPFEHHAIIAQGQHIFTFDERHLTFPGKCSYIFAKDVVNGNFTIAGTYKDGLLESITFADKKDSITVKKDNTVTLNGAASELPVRHKDLEVFRLYETVNIVSKAGVHIVCEPELLGCGVHVSGYYHGQMRGLLGNGNNEPYDDFLLPNGKIVTNEAVFGNSFKLNSGCENVETVDHHHHHPVPACDALFAADSSLRLCYPFVDPSTFKQACEHGMAAGIPDTEKAISMAYVAACRHKKIPVSTPKRFVKCKNSLQPMDVGDQFSVRVPMKAADVVIIIEQNKNNEVIFKELIQSLVTSLTNELTSKGINDIEYSLIGYGGEYQKWPSHYTKGGKLAFHDKAAQLKFVDPPKQSPVLTGCKQMDSFLEKFLFVKDVVTRELSLNVEGDAIREGLRYPFRAHAVKTLIGVVGHTHPSPIPMWALVRNIIAFGPQNGLQYNLITPLEAKVKDAKQTKNVVGFNDQAVFTLSDSKKKSSGSADLKKDLEYPSDSPVDFVVRKHGNVFLTNNFVQAKPSQRKAFVQVVTHQIADQITRTEQGLDCECKMVNPYDARNVCKLAYSKESKKSGTKGK